MPARRRRDRRPRLAHRRLAAWVDSVLATLSPRDKAAQLVWPQLFGDYTPTSSAGWTRVEQLITRASTSAASSSRSARRSRPPRSSTRCSAQRAAAARRRRLRDGRRLPPARRLLPAEQHRPRRRHDVSATDGHSAPRATRRSPTSMGRITALEGRALGMHIAFAPVLDVNNNPAQSGHRRALVRRGSASRRRHGRRVHSRHSGTRDDRHRRSTFPGTATPRRTRISPSRRCTRAARASTAWSSCRSAARSPPACRA